MTANRITSLRELLHFLNTLTAPADGMGRLLLLIVLPHFSVQGKDAPCKTSAENA